MIASDVFQDSLGRFLAPISELMNDPTVSEVMINGPFEVWVERKGKLEKTKTSFDNVDDLEAVLMNIAQYAGRPITNQNPILEAHLPDGSRVEAVMPPLAQNGPIVAIRRFSKSTLTIAKLISGGSLTREAAVFLGHGVRGASNIIISGGTGTGKTSLLGAISSFIEDEHRIVVIEDTREVQLQKSHVVYLESRAADERGKGRITIRDLLRATLRLRPDRIMVGEVRGGETLDLIQAMNTGHGGSMTTVHANSPPDALRRLETMAMMNDTSLPLMALREQVASAVGVVVQVIRDCGGHRRVSAICRVLGLSSVGEYVLRPIFEIDSNKELVRIKRRPAK